MTAKQQAARLRAAVRRVFNSHRWGGYDPTGYAKRKLLEQAAAEVRLLATTLAMRRLAAAERRLMVATYG